MRLFANSLESRGSLISKNPRARSRSLARFDGNVMGRSKRTISLSFSLSFCLFLARGSRLEFELAIASMIAWQRDGKKAAMRI